MLLSKLKKSLPVFCAIVFILSTNSLCSQEQWHTALLHGDLEKVRHILDQFPVLLNAPVPTMIPLGYAARYNHLRLAQFLLSRGADINARQVKHATSLHLACFSPTSSSDMVEFLIKKGADIHAGDQDGSTPLHYCRDETRAHLLVQNGADIMAKNTGAGFLPIHVAAVHNFTRLVTYYLDIKPDIVDALTRIHRTPLVLATANNSKESAAVLLQKGADVNTQDQFGLTPLHIACREDYDTFIKVLLCWDPDLHAENTKGKNPLRLAVGDCYNRNRMHPMPWYSPEQRLTQRRAAIRALLEHGTPIQSADDIKLIRKLQSQDFDPAKIILDAHAQAYTKLLELQAECGIGSLPADLEGLILAFTATPKLPTEKRKRTNGSEGEGTKESKKARAQ